jgi:hypothetical protein
MFISDSFRIHRARPPETAPAAARRRPVQHACVHAAGARARLRCAACKMMLMMAVLEDI